MWQWITTRLRSGNELEHQLGTPRALARFVAELPREDAGATLDAISAVFESAATLDLAPAVRLQALVALDDVAHGARSELAGRLLTNAPKQEVDESAWHRLVQHYGLVSQGYAAALAGCAQSERDAKALAFETLATARALQASAKLNMLHRMRYLEPPAGLWPRVEALFAATSRDAQAAAQLDLYPGDTQRSSVQCEYLVTALLEVAPIANMLPAQVHALDLFLRQHATHLRLGEQYDPAAYPFCVNALGDARPLRCMSGAGAKPGTRFFGLGETWSRLRAEQERATGARSLPEWAQTSQVSLERYRELLELLALHWEADRPRRTQRRQPAAGDILGAHDFGLVRRVVNFSDLAARGRSAEYDRTGAYSVGGMVNQHVSYVARDAENVPDELALRNLANLETKLEPGSLETWRLVDMSSDGLGVEVAGPAVWARAGMLLAYRDPASPRWSLAVVRRLSPGSGGRLQLGMRKLPGKGASMRLTVNDTRPPSASPAAGPSLHYDAIRLDGATPALLLPSGLFNPAWAYTLSSGPHWESIRLRRCVECGFDFELVEYTRAEQQRAA